ncbi:ATPase [Mesobacillus maritimus]|uniref:ATPase n=1 Tax=Mesobacillus maritimus TaxID=1643336 RepID=UPI00203F5CFB|nr:ATPase [Mesobacillus maritimus]MCM3670512.1 ATPase [Mesobacillus maritimus]
MNKSFWFPLIASIGTMIFLYVIGFLAKVDMLVFKFSLSYTEISLLPIFIGMVVGFICERIMKLKVRS